MNIDYFDKILGFTGLSIADAQHLVKELAASVKPKITLRLAILKSFTLEQIEPFLVSYALLHSVKLELVFGGFNQYAQEMLDSNSRINLFRPDLSLLFLHKEALFNDLLEFDLFLKDFAALKNLVDAKVTEITRLCESHHTISGANIFVSNLMFPFSSNPNLYENLHQNSIFKLINYFNEALATEAAKTTFIKIIDLNSWQRQWGAQNIFNEKEWFLIKNLICIGYYGALSKHIFKYIYARYFPSKKCLILDLDNILWGGVVGEDGPQGIKLGEGYPGYFYKKFQNYLKKLSSEGVLLAICSKNNPEDALEAINNHPEMILKSEDFVVKKINWLDKATNIREIAEELNIGLDSLVFIDDNPVERHLIQSTLPEVFVVPYSKIETLIDTIESLPLFWKLALVQEDITRTRTYKEQTERLVHKGNFNDLESYFKSLETVAIISKATPYDALRLSQLTQKTNQFNLTTKRYTEDDISNFLQEPGYQIYKITVSDRFGDNGLVGLMILRQVSCSDVEIDSFLLSCRVMNRTIEFAFLEYIFNKLQADKIENIIGLYFPTNKNLPVKDLYPSLGFVKCGNDFKYMLALTKTSLIKLKHYVKTKIEC